MSEKFSIASVAELLAHAKAIEEEAMDRYRELAAQMDIHHNPEVAELFRRMADIESKHVQRIVERAGETETDIPHMAPWDYQWPDCESPEAVVVTDVHYLMTPHHALTLALRCERRSFDFFSTVVESAEAGPVRDLAEELRDEESEHIRLMEEWIAKTPEPDDGWDDDPDPPSHQE